MDFAHNVLEVYLEILVVYTILVLEVIGIFIIAYSAIRGFINYIKERLKFNDTCIKIEIAKGLALGLEFKLGGEVLRTILVRTMDEIKVLAAIIVLRVILTYVIHWEITSEIHQDEEIRESIMNKRKLKQKENKEK
ncbi:DUF1622 domain-containing protein [Alkaliphilus peptidifermentans]|uniref:Uncharacterized membrane protein n=1 Tax=Alkaliphilus peptidifermentans DSM 18978 TaxID=1120976 RepID=A0A1G5J4H1_9FIRM|nr:DUF1622 domain-containing protein [Alkaliphilus peptidifermentans]SCY82850.1 Uncharacterized membrane protein [Alkaliphilus peptidifermentans DSM 18978]